MRVEERREPSIVGKVVFVGVVGVVVAVLLGLVLVPMFVRPGVVAGEPWHPPSAQAVRPSVVPPAATSVDSAPVESGPPAPVLTSRAGGRPSNWPTANASLPPAWPKISEPTQISLGNLTGVLFGGGHPSKASFDVSDVTFDAEKNELLYARWTPVMLSTSAADCGSAVPVTAPVVSLADSGPGRTFCRKESQHLVSLVQVQFNGQVGPNRILVVAVTFVTTG